MSADANAQGNAIGYASGRITKAPEWHGLVAWDLLFNGLTTGLFLTAALAELTVPEVFSHVAKASYPVALVLLLVDLICLVLDLGNPLRFHHMLRVFKPASPMSLGTWCLTIYSIPLTIVVGLGLLPMDWPALELARKAVVVLGILPALGSAVYKGVLLSTNAQPGWRDARWLGGYLTSAALMLGSAEMLTLSILMGREGATAALRPAVILLLLLNVVPLCLLSANLRPTLAQCYSERQLVRLAALTGGGGMGVPIVLLSVGNHPVVLLAAVFLLLAGSVATRFAIVRLPHSSPRDV